MYVRVALSQKANEIGFKFPTIIVGKIVVNNAKVSEFLEDLSTSFLSGRTVPTLPVHLSPY